MSRILSAHYCKKGVEALQKLAAAGEAQVHFLLFPIDSHKGAREQSISTICDRKSLPEFESGHRSENLCEEGARKVDATRDLLAQKGITGTPHIFFWTAASTPACWTRPRSAVV